MRMDVTDRELIIRRHLPFPRDLVWKAMTHKDHVNAWWGPEGFTSRNAQMDFRVGGAWTFEGVGPDGAIYPNRSDFKEISPPSKFVFDHGDGQRVWFEASVTLEEKDGGTLVTLRQLYPSKEARDEVVRKYGAVEGGKQHLAKLEAYVKEKLA